MPSGANTRSKSKGPFFELHEILAPLDLRNLLAGQREADLAEGRHDCAAILRRTFDKQVGVLGRVREAQQDRAGLADKQVRTAVRPECVADFLGLAILKRAHIPTNREDSLRTSGDSPPSCRTPGTPRRLARVVGVDEGVTEPQRQRRRAAASNSSNHSRWRTSRFRNPWQPPCLRFGLVWDSAACSIPYCAFRQSEQPPGVRRGGGGEPLRRHAAQAGKALGRLHHVGRLVPPLAAAKGLRHEVRAVGLDQQPIFGAPAATARSGSNFLFV